MLRPSSATERTRSLVTAAAVIGLIVGLFVVLLSNPQLQSSLLGILGK